MFSEAISPQNHNYRYQPVTWEANPKVSKGRSQTSSVFIALCSPPQRRNPCVTKRSIPLHTEAEETRATVSSTALATTSAIDIFGAPATLA